MELLFFSIFGLVLAVHWLTTRHQPGHKAPAPASPYPAYLRLATKALLVAALIFLVLPHLLRFFDPSAGSFGIDTLNALAFGAVLLAAILHLAFIAYGKVFPSFKTYQEESLERDAKLFENLTDDLETELYYAKRTGTRQSLAIAVEARKISQFKFLIRCVRLSFCLLALYALVVLSEHVLTAVLTVVPK